MPLPNLNRQCTVRARSTGNQCLNPAAFGCATCTRHGAWLGAKKRVGKAHPQYRHGERTKEAIQKYRKTMSELQYLEQIGHESGVFTGARTTGRRLKTTKIELTINQ